MSFEEAACVCESYMTAFLNIFMVGEFEDGQTAILHGGGGGVNTAGDPALPGADPEQPN